MRDVDVGMWVGDHQYHIPAPDVVMPGWMFACSWVRLHVRKHPIRVRDLNDVEAFKLFRGHGPTEFGAFVSSRDLGRTNNESEKTNGRLQETRMRDKPGRTPCTTKRPSLPVG